MIAMIRKKHRALPKKLNLAAVMGAALATAWFGAAGTAHGDSLIDPASGNASLTLDDFGPVLMGYNSNTSQYVMRSFAYNLGGPAGQPWLTVEILGTKGDSTATLEITTGQWSGAPGASTGPSALGGMNTNSGSPSVPSVLALDILGFNYDGNSTLSISTTPMNSGSTTPQAPSIKTNFSIDSAGSFSDVLTWPINNGVNYFGANTTSSYTLTFGTKSNPGAFDPAEFDFVTPKNLSDKNDIYQAYTEAILQGPSVIVNGTSISGEEYIADVVPEPRCPISLAGLAGLGLLGLVIGKQRCRAQ
jgi:hypothetical protein